MRSGFSCFVSRAVATHLLEATRLTQPKWDEIVWTVFVLTFLVASINTNIVNILIYLFVDLGFLCTAGSYFATADGHEASSLALKKTGGVFCFLAGLLGWFVIVRRPEPKPVLLTRFQVPDVPPVAKRGAA